MGIIYFFYIIILIFFLISIMIKCKQLYYQIYHSIKLYFIITSHKSVLLGLYNYLLIFLIYFPSLSEEENLKNKFFYFSSYFSNIYELHKNYKDTILTNINLYGLGLNSTEVYRKISENTLCDFLISFEENYNISCQSLSNNISSYGLDSIMVFYIQSMSNILMHFKTNMNIIKKYGFKYNELLYGTDSYNNLSPTDPELLKKYNELNPFNIINGDEIRDLNTISEVVIKQAFEYICNSIFDDIEGIFNQINNFEIYLGIDFFLVVIIFNFLFYFPFLFKKNKEIKQIRHMLLIIPKDVLYKLLVEEDNDETKNKF